MKRPDTTVGLPEPSQTRASFDRAASRYDRHAHVQRQMAAWLAEWIPGDRSGRALEMGAGTGLLTRWLVPWSGELLATDISPAMCAVGRATVLGASWTVMSAEAPEGAGWDWIFSSSMLQWASDPEQILSGWRRRLAPGGRILAGLYVAETLAELRDVTGLEGPVGWRSVEAWRRAVHRAGLAWVRDAADRRVFRYPSALQLWRSLHRVGASPGRRVSPGQLRRWLRQYESRFCLAGGVSATWKFYRFEAMRPRGDSPPALLRN